MKRETSVQVVELDSGKFIIIASLSTQKDTQVISVEPTTGVLLYQGRHGLDVFPSERDAIDHLSTSNCTIKNSVCAKAILGYAALGSVALLLLATRLRLSITKLPCGDAVYTVTESQWVRIPLGNPQYQVKGEGKNAADLTDIQIDGMHYFSETRDLTRPFPSEYSIEHPDAEFVWNQWLSTPLKAIGLQYHCVTLLQVCPEALLEVRFLQLLLVDGFVPSAVTFQLLSERSVVLSSGEFVLVEILHLIKNIKELRVRLAFNYRKSQKPYQALVNSVLCVPPVLGL